MTEAVQPESGLAVRKPAFGAIFRHMGSTHFPPNTPKKRHDQTPVWLMISTILDTSGAPLVSQSGNLAVVQQAISAEIVLPPASRITRQPCHLAGRKLAEKFRLDVYYTAGAASCNCASLNDHPSGCAASALLKSPASPREPTSRPCEAYHFWKHTI